MRSSAMGTALKPKRAVAPASAPSASNSSRSAETGAAPPLSSRAANSRGNSARGPTPPKTKAKVKAKPKAKAKEPAKAKGTKLFLAKQPLDPETMAAMRLQRHFRRRVAQREAQAGMALLREWDELVAAVRVVHRDNLARSSAALTLQCAQRQRAARNELARRRRAKAALRLQCAARRRLARRALLSKAALRVQCAFRQKAARKKLHDTYWAYAYGLLEDETAIRIQKVRPLPSS